jgi:integrase/recombinase XerD
MKTLTDHLADYLRLRRQLGFKLDVAARLLRNFIRFLEQKRAAVITTKLALQWATQAPGIQPVQKANRLGIVRRFAQYLSAIDPRTEVPARKLLPYQCRRRNPHLYRVGDVVRLIEAARQIDPTCPIKGASYATLIGLLAVTGMRSCEALGLDREDVDLTGGVLTVRHGKGGKTRLVPLHSSTREALQRYAALRDSVFPRSSCTGFFVSERGTRLFYWGVNRWFLLVACQLGLRKPGDRRGPRLHDLRHYFAIQTMLRWYQSKTDVETHLPDLTTYLGHVHARDTYWYLSAVPELLQLATRRRQQMEAER